MLISFTQVNKKYNSFNICGKILSVRKEEKDGTSCCSKVFRNWTEG